MAVEVKLIGRLGNNLFQYVLGRILAERHGLALRCEQVPYVGKVFLGHRLDHGRDATLSGLLHCFPDVRLEHDGEVCEQPEERLEVGVDPTWDGQSIDLARLLEPGRVRRLVLKGWFQRAEYYLPFEQQIKRWLRFRPARTRHHIAPEDVVVNVRRGLDMAMVDWVVSPEYYAQALSLMKSRGRVYVCGTGVDRHVRSALEPFRPVYVDGDPYHHLSFLMRFRRVVMSNSTFCWWAVFLSGADELLAPRPASGYGFSGYPGVDLRLPSRQYQELDADTEIFHPFLRDQGCRAWIEQRQGSEPLDLYMAGVNGHATRRLRLAPERLGFVEWLLDRAEPISGKELYTRFIVPGESRSDREQALELTIRTLLESSLLRINPDLEELVSAIDTQRHS